MIEVTFSNPNPFRPHRTVRGFLTEVRDRKRPDDLMEMDWEAAQFSTDRQVVEDYNQEMTVQGWEARLMAGIAEQMVPGQDFILHRLH